jgi:hypothetical protein
MKGEIVTELFNLFNNIDKEKFDYLNIQINEKISLGEPFVFITFTFENLNYRIDNNNIYNFGLFQSDQDNSNAIKKLLRDIKLKLILK